MKNTLKILPNKDKYNKIREKVLGKFGSRDYKDSPEVLRKTMSTILNEDLTSLLPNIKVPTLLIWGEEDTATPMRDAKIMEKNIPDAGLVSYKGAGHFSYIDKLGNVLAVLDKFLENDRI